MGRCECCSTTENVRFYPVADVDLCYECAVELEYAAAEGAAADDLQTEAGA